MVSMDFEAAPWENSAKKSWPGADKDLPKICASASGTKARKVGILGTG